MPKNKVTVRINGAEYSLTGDEAEDYLFSIASYVDKKVKEILSSNTKHSNTSAAILAAVTIADELFKLKRENEYYKKKVNEPEEKYEKEKYEYDKLMKNYKELENLYEKYKNYYDNSLDEVNKLKDEFTSLKEEKDKDLEDYEKLLKENAFLKEHNEKLEREVNNSKQETSGLKNELLENQIELVNFKKNYKDYREVEIRKKNV